MFNLFKKTNITSQPSATHESISVKITNLDCPSCAVDLDLALEDLPGVVSAKTNYAKSVIKISFDPKLVNQKKINKTLTDLGYLK